MKWRESGRETLFSGYIKLIRWSGVFERFDGAWSKPIERELMLRGEAVAVLPIDLARDSLLLIRQFRVGAAEQPGGPWQSEILAGVLEPGESLESVARREAREEAGLTLSTLVPMLSYQPSPGACDETLHLFLAPTDLSDAGGVHGLHSENEDIESWVEPVEQALEGLHDGRFRNSMTLLALQWLALQRASGNWLPTA